MGNRKIYVEQTNYTEYELKNQNQHYIKNRKKKVKKKKEYKYYKQSITH